jgi:multidrug efflux pump subunit AcrB
MPWILGNRISAMRLRLDPERMRAHNLSSDDVMKALQGCRMMGSPQRLGQSMGKTWQTEDRSMIYVVVHTPPDSTLEYTNARSHEVQAIAKGIEGVTSAPSYAGYEVLAEGRGSNDGAFLIKLKKRSDRKLTSRQILELLAEKCRTISTVTLEFFEPAEVDELRGHHP